MFGQDYSFSRVFTPGGRLSKVIYPSGRLVDFDRSTCQCNVDGITTSADESDPPVTLMENLAYSPYGAAKSAAAGSGGTIANQKDESARLSVANPGQPREHTLKYDGNGNLTSVRYASMPWEDRAYGYPIVAKVGGLQSQGGKGEAVVYYRKPLTTRDLEPSGFPDLSGRSSQSEA